LWVKDGLFVHVVAAELEPVEEPVPPAEVDVLAVDEDPTVSVGQLVS
jgi:hypothetical protein